MAADLERLVPILERAFAEEAHRRYCEMFDWAWRCEALDYLERMN